MKKERDTNPSGRIATVEEICQVIIFLTSKHSRKITGEIVHVDGGKSLSIRGQQSWWGMANDPVRAFEVGESTNVVDFVKSKLKTASHGKLV
jgi:hypothetical protein